MQGDSKQGVFLCLLVIIYIIVIMFFLFLNLHWLLLLLIFLPLFLCYSTGAAAAAGEVSKNCKTLIILDLCVTLNHVWSRVLFFISFCSCFLILYQWIVFQFYFLLVVIVAILLTLLNMTLSKSSRGLGTFMYRPRIAQLN